MEEKQKKKKSYWWILIVGVFILIAIFGGIMSRIQKKLKEKENAIQHNSTESVEPEKAPSKNDPVEIAIGDTVITDDYEFTFDGLELSYKVLPPDTSGLYQYLEADEGEVYIHVTATVKNTSKRDLRCDKVFDIEADYNDGYTYTGFERIEDNLTGFTYANIHSIDPLKTETIHYFISCPEEVETSENPLFITIKMKDKSKYKYVIR